MNDIDIHRSNRHTLYYGSKTANQDKVHLSIY